MLHYPILDEREQQRLPSLQSEPTKIVSKFEDSTHDLWFCDTVEGAMVLKGCKSLPLSDSPFWLGINSLFDADFPANLGQAEKVFTHIANKGSLAMPSFVAAEPSSFVLTQYIDGIDLEPSSVTDEHIEQLAQHIAHLHQHTSAQWGALLKPQFSADKWGERLHDTLVLLAGQREIDIPEAVLQTGLFEATQLQEETFVPIMPDLRWDQFRQLNTGQIALMDLDAFVMGPASIELVLLEYILTPEQFVMFQTIYKQQLPWPNYQQQRSSYQLLLFLMNVLGETDLAKWMAR